MDDVLDVVAYCDEFRKLLLDFESKIKKLSNDIKNNDVTWDKWEQIANTILALRHIEDARMRLWKVIQYNWDWISIYDK